MKTFIFLFIIGVLAATPALAQKKVAVVKLLRGDVDVLTLGKTAKLKAEQWVEEGAVVKTSDKSFVKLVFIDKSQMNVGPNSEMKIENFSGKDSGVIELVKGKIRSQVTKDYLQMDDKNKSKLFIKTANAVMGVRGTDFMISSNGKTSAVVLFEGEVVFNQLKNTEITNSANLEQIVDRGVRMFPGEFSVVEPSRMPTVPSLLNVQQRETLEKNDSFESDRGPSNSVKEEAGKSVVPEGLNGEQVSNDSKVLKTEVAQMANNSGNNGNNGNNGAAEASSKNPEGFVQGDRVKPANGSFLHVESGVIVPPAPDSRLDKLSNTYMSGSGNGTVAKNGDYVPPKNMEITNDGKILVAAASKGGEMMVREIEKPVPIMNIEGPTFTEQGVVPVAGTVDLLPRPPINDILNGGAVVNNVLNQANTDLKQINQVENVPTHTNTTIRVNAKD
ncbi:MAG TPA: FecR family protein [Bacteriovoracaceae bacterium]|nr:FecR family protein [Bacteriovoracaceae bacterium]